MKRTTRAILGYFGGLGLWTLVALGIAAVAPPMPGESPRAADDGVAFAAGPPVGASGTTFTVKVDGVATGTTRLSTMSVVGLPSWRTRAWVPTVGQWFELVPATGTAAIPDVLVNAPDGRQWTRSTVPNRTFLAAAFWGIDPVSGSDENQCWGATQAAADAVPCKTLAEVNRRLIGAEVTQTVVFHLLSDTASTDSTVMTNVGSHSGSGFPIFLGKKTQLGSNYTVTAYATANPAANTGFLLSAVGIGAAGNLGHLISNLAESKWAFIQDNPTGNQVRLSNPNNFDQLTFGGGFAGVTFTVGETVRVWTLPALQQWPWTSQVLFGGADQIHLLGAAIGSFDVSLLGSSSPQIAHTILDGIGFQGAANATFSGDLFALHASALSGGFSNAFQGCAIRGVTVQFTSSPVILLSANFDIQHGQLQGSDHSVILENGPSASLSIFGATTIGGAVFCTGQGSFSVYSSSSTTYGSGNTVEIYNAGPGSVGAISRTASTVTTTAANPIVLAGTGYGYAAIPISDTVHFASVQD
jgi:hypothetical protein